MMITTTRFRFRHIALPLLLVVCATLRLSAQLDQWSLVGPTGGWINAVVVIGNSVLAAPYNNGMFRSTDNGEHWAPVLGPFQDSWSSAFYVHGGTLFALGEHDYRSTDEGRTWTPFVIDPTTYSFGICTIGDSLYCAGTSGVISRSLDDGITWQTVGSAPGPWTSVFAVHGSSLYISNLNGFYRSDDFGVTWTKVTVTPTGVAVRAFAAHDSTLVITIGDEPTNISDRLYRSTDDGATWEPADTGVTADRIRAIVWNGSEFFASGGYHGGVFRSTDGTNWTTVAGGFTDDISALCISGTTVYAGSNDDSGGGLYRSDDNGVTWKQINDGISSYDVDDMMAFRGVLYAGTHSYGMFKSEDDGDHWTVLNAGRGFAASHGMTTTNDALLLRGEYQGSGVDRSTDGGVTWKTISVNGATVDRVIANGDLVIALAERPSKGYDIYRSTDGGLTWAATGFSFTFYGYADIHFVGSELFATTAKGLFRSRDAGTTWTSVNAGLADSGATAIVKGENALVLASNTYPNSVHIYRSLDDGDSWQQAYIGGDSDIVNGFCASGHNIFAWLSYHGAMRSADDGLTWEPMNDGLYNHHIGSMMRVDEKLYVGIDAGGIYRMTSSLLSGVDEPAVASLPTAVYPNPCHGSATIRYQVPDRLPAGAAVQLEIFDRLGARVSTLVARRQTPGNYLATVDTHGMTPGAYFYRLRIGEQSRTSSFVVLGE